MPSLIATRMTLPLSLEEITPDWLTKTLSLRFPGIRVSGYRRGSGYRGTSTSAPLELDYAERCGHGDLPGVVYVKGGFDPVMRRRVWAALIQEARFYAEFGPHMPINIPRCYFAGVDEEAKQGVLLLEDLTARGVRFGSNLVTTSVDLMAQILEQQALYHAKWWQSPTLAAYRGWAEPQHVFLRWLFRESNWEQIRTRAYAGLVPLVLPDRDFALRALERLWQINSRQPQTLQHGDCHAGNLFFERDGRPGFLDWQCAFPGAPAHDVMWAMICSLDTETRRANEAALLRHYLQALRAAGVDAPSFDEMFLSYRQNIMHGMSSAVGNPFDMQNEEITNASSFRTLHAALELDLIGALGMR